MSAHVDISFAEIPDLVTAVQSGTITAEAVALEALKRIEAYDAVQPAVWITRLSVEAVLEQARTVDRRCRAGANLPLAGTPFAVKDNIDVAGWPTTAGCPAFAYTPEESAEVVTRLQAAGAILVGKTNLDQFATGLVGSRTPYGVCGAVHNRAYVSGGSSAGSAVAVAAGLVAFALGTDTAGSGRVPAALNGLIGLKPARGRWSTRGVVPACRSLDCVSVFTSKVLGSSLVDAVLTAYDAEDPYSRHVVERPVFSPGTTLRVGVPRLDQRDWMSDRESERLYDRALERIAALGCELVEIDMEPLHSAASLLYQGPWVAERTAVVEKLLRERPGVIHPVVREILRGGLLYTAVDAFRGEYELKALRRAAEDLWRSVEVLALPTTATTYRVREVLAEPLALNANLGRYTNFVNLLDMSAIAVPAGWRANATGFGVTFMGPAFTDRALLDLASRYEENETMPHPPLDTDGVKTSVSLAVVGAHLAAMPLHWQLTSRDATLVKRCKTAEAYRLYAMAGTSPPKPALVHVGPGGGAIEVEVYALAVEAFGSFVAEVPAPLAIGTVTLEDGTEVKGFVAEPRALAGAEDITALGGWRAYIARETAS